MEAQTETIAALVQAINAMRVAPIPNDLWSADDIAAYLKMSKHRVQSKIVVREDFPAVITLPTTTGGGAKRWRAKEVQAWAMKFRA